MVHLSCVSCPCCHSMHMIFIWLNKSKRLLDICCFIYKGISLSITLYFGWLISIDVSTSAFGEAPLPASSEISNQKGRGHNTSCDCVPGQKENIPSLRLSYPILNTNGFFKFQLVYPQAASQYSTSMWIDRDLFHYLLPSRDGLAGHPATTKMAVPNCIGWLRFHRPMLQFCYRPWAVLQTTNGYNPYSPHKDLRPIPHRYHHFDS